MMPSERVRGVSREANASEEVQMQQVWADRMQYAVKRYGGKRSRDRRRVQSGAAAGYIPLAT